MKRRSPPRPALARSSKSASALIECMLKEMQRGLRDPLRMESPEWVLWFGAKQSMVANVQKLVQALAAIPDGEAEKVNSLPPDQQGAPLTPEEMGLLTAWLAEGREEALNAPCGTGVE